MKFEIIQKAWNCFYKDSKIYPEDFDYCPKYPYECYAETRNKAKYEYFTYIHEVDGEYKNVIVLRDKYSDIILVNGEEKRRGNYLAELKYKMEKEERMKEHEKLIEKINLYPNDSYFYIQDRRSYVGNSVLWFGPNNRGYTIDIDKAGKYSKEEIIDLFKNGKRETDIIWPADEVENNIKRHVDSQYLDRSKIVR